MGMALGAAALSPHFGLHAEDLVRLRRQPALQRLHGRNGTLVWTTLQPGRAALEWSSPSATQTVSAATTIFHPERTGLSFPYYQHQVELEGLTPGAEHTYRVLMDNREAVPASDLRFRAPGEGDYRFLVFGDSGWDSWSQSQIAALMQQEHPNLVLVTGDLGYPWGTYAYYESNYFDYYAGLLKSVPFFPCPGNHDYYGDALRSYLEMNLVPSEGVPEEDAGRYYSFDWGNTHFVSLDSMGGLFEAVEANGRMLEWLDRDLGSTRKFWKVVFFHHPPYAAGPNETDAMCILARERIVPILERHGVHIVFSGHEHSYQRSEAISNGHIVLPGEGIVYITTGGGGSVLYPVFASPRVAAGASVYHYLRVENQGSRMTIQAISEQGLEFDRITLAPPPRLSGYVIVGDQIRIVGTQLACLDAAIPAEPLPLQVAGTSVLCGGELLPLFYVSNSEIVARVPYPMYPGASVSIVTPNGVAELPIVPEPELSPWQAL